MTIHSIRLILAGKTCSDWETGLSQTVKVIMYQTEFYKGFLNMRRSKQWFRLVITQIFNRFFSRIRLPLNRQIIFIMIFFRRHPVRKHIILKKSICLI